MTLAKRLQPYQAVITHLQFIATRDGYVMELRDPGPPVYQIARLSRNGIRVVVYPHKTSAGNYHARARDENSADKPGANELLKQLALWVNNKGTPT